MNKTICSTGHKELDDILKSNGILDHEEQKKQKQVEHLKELIRRAKEITKVKDKFDWVKKLSSGSNKNPLDFKPQECLIERARQREIEKGFNESQITKIWLISCPCRKCNPFYL